MPRKPDVYGTFTVEVKDIGFYAGSRAEALSMMRDLRRDLDLVAREVLRVGPHSKVVQTRFEEADDAT